MTLVALRVPLSPSRGARARVCPPALGGPPGARPALAHRGRPAPWRPAPALRAGPRAGPGEHRWLVTGRLRGWGGSEGATQLPRQCPTCCEEIVEAFVAESQHERIGIAKAFCPDALV